jgi:hypothetical protein
MQTLELSTMRGYLAAVVIALLVLPAWPSAGQDAGLFRLGPLALHFSSGWQFDGSKRPIEGRGPNGEVVMVSYRGLEPGAPDNVRRQHIEMTHGFAKTRMPGLAESKGTVIRPVTEATRDDGRFMYSSATQTTKQCGATRTLDAQC